MTPTTPPDLSRWLQGYPDQRRLLGFSVLGSRNVFCGRNDGEEKTNCVFRHQLSKFGDGQMETGVDSSWNV